MLAERTFDTGTVVINYGEYTEEGEKGTSKAPLVLLHGGSARWQSAMPIIQELVRALHLYAPDFRGHGKSGWTPGHYTLRDYIADTRAFLEKVVGEPAVLMGHSLGGQVAIMLAAARPDLVCGLIIGDAPFDRDLLRTLLRREQDRLLYWRELAGSTRPMEEIIEALKNAPIIVGDRAEVAPARVVFGEESGWYDYMVENLSGHDPEMLSAVVEFEQMHAGYEYERLFPSIDCPVLILRANPQSGGTLTDGEIERAQALLSNVVVAEIVASGHELYTYDAAPVLPAVLPFLEGLD